MYRQPASPCPQDSTKREDPGLNVNSLDITMQVPGSPTVYMHTSSPGDESLWVYPLTLSLVQEGS